MENNSDQSRAILMVLRSQSGDKVAFDELLGSVQMRLWRYVSGLTGDAEVAQDILQNVFLILYRKIGWLDDPNHFRAWAYRIASRESFRYLKKETRWREQIRDEEFLSQIPTVNSEPEYDPEMTAKIPALLSGVSAASRAVLILHYLDGLTLSETAEILDISCGTVKSRLAYGLANLRRQTKETGLRS